MTTNTESYEMKQIMRRVAACLTAPMHELGGRCDWAPGAWKDENIKNLISDSRWRTNSRWPPAYTIVMKDSDGNVLWDGHDNHHSEFVYFTNPRYAASSERINGPLQQVESIEINVNEKSKVFTNFTDDPVNISYEESLVLTDTHERSTTDEWHFDVSETVEIGGEAYGISASSSTTASGGESGSESTSDSNTEEKAVAVSINFELQPGDIIRVHTYYHESRTRQEYDTHAILDFDINMIFSHWPRDDKQARIRNEKTDIIVRGVDGMYDYFRNHDANQPLNGSFHWVSRVKNCINAIMDPSTRTYHIKGVEEKTIQDNEDFKLEQLQHDALPPGIPVINMSEEGNMHQYKVR